MSDLVHIGQAKTPAVSAGYIAFYPCFQATSDTQLTDRSGKGNHGTINSLTTSEAWSTTANRASNPTTANHHFTLAKSAFSVWKWNATRKDSLFISLRMKPTLPGSATPFMGNCNSATEGGLKFNVDNTGKWQQGFYDKVNSASQFSALSTVDASWGSNDRTIALHLDGPNNTFTRYVDGVVLEGPVALSSVTVLEPQSSTFDWTFGASQLSQVTGVAMGMYGVHILAIPQASGSIAKPDHLAMRLHRAPLLLVSGGAGEEVPY